ncbi:hypothetical protein [Sphingobacterium corticibacter]|uniref:Uncharacterized protein n=1 Tax=Sphingobacterium corticibacter TaxID=2171749 RepID=A0A2T8HK64_9SPHI|nr:hypothetical protein [Sphingobacterium corticibacter]PVH25783.1 hypothetical protein DC487_07570 [Sphingobacterium corticibacter]
MIEIPEKIDPSEKIVRFLFSKHLKKSKNLDKFRSTLDSGLINSDYVFYDTRGEVSMQRKDYVSDERCLQIGNSIPLELVGYVSFPLDLYDNTIILHKQEPGREEFEATLLWSPLDSENVERLDRPVCSDDAGLPAHCGITYVNPSELINEEPNTAIRMFSRRFFKRCALELVG